MILFPPGTSVSEAMVQAKNMDKKINSELFTKPVELEYEKVFCPYLLMKKKKYAGLKFENDPCKGKIDAKGIEMVRRDNCKIVSITQKKIIDVLLKEQNPSKAIDLLKNTLRDLVNGNIGLPLLTISKALKKLPKPLHWKCQRHANVCQCDQKKFPGDKYYKSLQPHALLVQKLERRNPAESTHPSKHQNYFK